MFEKHFLLLLVMKYLLLLKGENHIYRKEILVNASFNSIYLAVFDKMSQPTNLHMQRISCQGARH